VVEESKAEGIEINTSPLEQQIKRPPTKEKGRFGLEDQDGLKRFRKIQHLSSSNSTAFRTNPVGKILSTNTSSVMFVCQPWENGLEQSKHNLCFFRIYSSSWKIWTISIRVKRKHPLEVSHSGDTTYNSGL
jgi:hypothetical protein